MYIWACISLFWLFCYKDLKIVLESNPFPCTIVLLTHFVGKCCLLSYHTFHETITNQINLHKTLSQLFTTTKISPVSLHLCLMFTAIHSCIPPKHNHLQPHPLATAIPSSVPPGNPFAINRNQSQQLSHMKPQHLLPPYSHASAIHSSQLIQYPSTTHCTLNLPPPPRSHLFVPTPNQRLP